MIQKLRNPYVMKWGLYAIIGLTIPAFVLFYGFDKQQSQKGFDVGAYVTLYTEEGKVELHRQDMERMKQQAAQYFLQVAAAGANIAPQQYGMVRAEIYNSLQPREVADFAVGQIALEQRLQKQDIRVTNAQVTETLSNQGLTREQLNQILQGRGISEFQYAAEVSEDIKDSMAEQTVTRIARTSLLELWNEYLLGNEKISAQMVRFNIPFLSEEAATEEEIQARYDKLVAEKSPNIIERAKRTYEYVILPPPAQTREIPTEEQIRAAYDKAPADDEEIATEGGTRIRQILLSTNKAMTPEELAAAKAEAEDARKRITSGEDFAAVANEVSQDPRNVSWNDEGTTATLRGGELPYLVQGDQTEAWGESWNQFVQSAGPGKVSDVIETPQGLAVVEVLDRRDAGKMTYEKAHDVLLARVQKTLDDAAARVRQDILHDNLSKMREEAASQASLAGIARALGVNVMTTSATLATNTFIPPIGNMSSERETISTLRKGRPSPVLQTSSGATVVLRIVDEIPEVNKTLEEARAEVERQVKHDKEVANAEKKIEEIRTRIASGELLTSATLAVDPTLTVETLEPFTRAEPAQQLRSVDQVTTALTNAKKGDVLTLKSGLPSSPNELILLSVNEIASPTVTDFMKDIREMESGMLVAKKQGYVEEYRRDAKRLLKAEYSDIFDRPSETGKKRKRD